MAASDDLNRFAPGAPRSANPDGPESRWLFLQGDRLLVPDGRPAIPEERPMAADAAPIALGRIDGTECWAVSVPDDCAAPEGFRFLGLRGLLDRLPEPEFRAAGTALHLLRWDRSFAFCPACGDRLAPLAPETRTKTCPGCETIHHPRISPAAIVRVARGDRLLLARSSRDPDRSLFSVIAGYVEIGETLEETVRREIREEVGIRVRNVRYFDSQPWPFSGSLMAAFTADFDGGEIRVDGREILEAGWFSADDLPLLPPPGSVSRTLIDDFISTTR